MIPTILLITSLTTGTVDVMSFNDPVSCYNYVQRNQDQERFKLECIPAGAHAVNKITQNFYDFARLFNLVGGITKDNNE
jgi:hypothetical protein